jgi:uncharacterized protein (TIGR03032 family)
MSCVTASTELPPVLELTPAETFASPAESPPVSTAEPAPPPLRSVHSTSFARILEERGISVLVTTYQAGKLVMLRAEEGRVNTHFRGFSRPMGLAVAGGRLAVGTALEVWEFHDSPAVARRLEPAGRHDTCFLPRRSHTTGDVQIHEMAWAPDRLWFVNTRFSCLCTLDSVHSFVPRWRPPFISALALEDRCHLNGMGMVDGRPRYVTALGNSNDDGGWRLDKRSGGLLMKVPSGEVLLCGLSMPHSPRWHAGRLWLLESGNGTLGFVDPAVRRYRPIAELPGFTRGLDFHGNLAFVGLSQVRETAIFSGLPLTDRLAERSCGVWIVDITTGQTMALLRFEDAVQEVFAVQVLPATRFPDVINDNPKLIGDCFVMPDAALDEVPDPIRHRVAVPQP